MAKKLKAVILEEENACEPPGVPAEPAEDEAAEEILTAPAQESGEVLAGEEIIKALSEEEGAVPIFLRGDFNDMADRFFTAYPDAQRLKREIAEILCGEEVSPAAPFEDAYIKAVTRRFRDPTEMLADDEFIEKYILTDSYILQKLKAALVRELRDSKAPRMLCGGGAQIVTPVNRPKNLKEAAQMTEKYLSQH